MTQHPNWLRRFVAWGESILERAEAGDIAAGLWCFAANAVVMAALVVVAVVLVLRHV